MHDSYRDRERMMIDAVQDDEKKSENS